MKNIKAVLFDLVGTLIYVKDPVGYVYSSVASSFGFKTDYKKLEEAFIEVMSKKSTPHGGETEERKWWKEIVSEVFSSCGYDLKDKFDLIFEALFKEFTRKSAWAVYPEVVPALEKLSVWGYCNNPIQIGLISNFDSRLEIILKELDLYKYFNCLAYSGKVGFSKPDYKIFQYALKELNVLPEESIYIGDSLKIDYEPAMELGIETLLIDRENHYTGKGINSILNLEEIFFYL